MKKLAAQEKKNRKAVFNRILFLGCPQKKGGLNSMKRCNDKQATWRTNITVPQFAEQQCKVSVLQAEQTPKQRL